MDFEDARVKSAQVEVINIMSVISNMSNTQVMRNMLIALHNYSQTPHSISSKKRLSEALN
jgi:hypothetical protein